MSIFSGSIISYILSKLFIIKYLENIGLEALINQALVDDSTVPSLTLAIVVIVSALWLIFMIPSMLRYLYHVKIDLFEEYHKENKKNIATGLVVCLFIPPMLLVVLISVIKWDESLGFLTYFLPLILFWYSIRKKVEEDKKWEATYGAVCFSLSMTLLFLPFLFIFSAIYSITVDSMGICALIFVVAIIWFLYSLVYGIRITENNPIQYVIDGVIAVLVIFLLSWFTPISLIKEPVAEVIGLKDKEPRIYAISEKYFMEIKHDIDTHWYHYQNDEKTEGNAVFYVQREADNKVYINTQIIFRSDKHMVLCPPNYNVIKQKEGACFIVSREYLTPTTFKTMPFINKSEKVL